MQDPEVSWGWTSLVDQSSAARLGVNPGEVEELGEIVLEEPPVEDG